jgi:hypothetical protein
MDDDIATFDFAKKSVMMGAGFQGMPGTPPSHRARGVYAAGNRAFHLKRNYMKRSLAMRLLSALLVVFPITIMQAEDAIVEDTDDLNAPITNITLAWSPNAPEENVVLYNVYYGRVSGSYVRLVTVTATTASIGVRGSKETYFAVTAVDANGRESDVSQEVQWP